MNFYNPYYLPYRTATKTGFFSNLIKNFNLSSIINGTQKTLNTVNQIIPLVKQARPMMDNARTMFKLMNEFSRDDTKKKNIKSSKKNETKKTTSSEIVSNNQGPTFFQ